MIYECGWSVKREQQTAKPFEVSWNVEKGETGMSPPEFSMPIIALVNNYSHTSTFGFRVAMNSLERQFACVTKSAIVES